ncbi:MAG TPA: ATP-binding protein, partial [Thermoanaerobaculia bacterium]
ELLPHVFEPFRQGAAAASGQIGLGLGLAIVHQLVTLHGGAVQVQSTAVGRGATFAIVLPRGAAAVQQPGSQLSATVADDDVPRNG